MTSVLVVTGPDGTDVDSTVAVSGYETSKATVAITHNKPTAADPSASALMLSLQGTSTAAQGLLIDTSASYATTGKLLSLRRAGSEVLSLTGAGRLRLGGSGSLGVSGLLEVRGDFDESLSPICVEVNRDGTGSYRPIFLFGRYHSNAANPFDVTYQGISSILNYGEGVVGTVDGTATASEFFIDVYDNDSQNSEYAALRAGINMTPGSDTSFPTATPGRAWVIDGTLEGPLTNQANLLTGLTMMILNKAAGAPSAGPSVAIGVATVQNALGNSSTSHPVDYGVLVAGHSGGGTTTGFKVGVKVGGFGTGWLASGRSIIDEAAVFEDWRSGLKIWKRQTGGTQGAAIEIGYDGTGVPSTAELDGLRMGGDSVLYRAGTNQLSTGSGDALRCQSYLNLNNPAGVGFVQMATQTSAVGASGTSEARIYVRNNKIVIAYNDAGTTRYLTALLNSTQTNPATWTHGTGAP